MTWHLGIRISIFGGVVRPVELPDHVLEAHAGSEVCSPDPIIDDTLVVAKQSATRRRNGQQPAAISVSVGAAQTSLSMPLPQ